ncbi:hypothetical protein [Methanosphaera sp. BMS]|uniref:hypothetical protein n=1 Tax=Methanosphaera sp. BMS TaxID=1789762 RepID=UPI000DC1E214|nr:hypothetical protein [Methanosphaera sp. BMS]AWX32903.1 hypothetical protein AW729_07225 [Methanosphaera sp. BMS]
MIKNSRYMIIFLALLIAGMSVAVAADIDDTASASSDVSDAVEVDTTSTVDTQAVASVSEDNNQKIIKETKSVKSDENDPIIVTNDGTGDNFDTLFTVVSPGVHQIKSEYSGKTIKINTDITRNEHSYIINVPITLTSDYNNTIDLNTSNGYEPDIIEHWTSINFTSGASGSTISYMQFHNSQIFVLDADYITFDHITVTANQPCGKGTGIFALREGSTHITVTNNYFNINNNGGISVIALTNAEDCLIDHNVITGSGSVGNLIYLNTYFYNTNPAPTVTNRHNTISYNTLTGPTTPVNTCFAIAIAGPDNTIEHNDIYYGGTGITTNWQGSYDVEIIELEDDDFETVYEGNKYYYNNLYNGATFLCGNYSVVENNYFTGTSNFAGHSNVTSNTFINSITVKNNVRYHSNTQTGQMITVSKPNSCFKDNIGGTLKINGAYTTYNCGGNTFSLLQNPYYGYYQSCNGNCPNCVPTRGASLSGSSKNMKSDSTVEIVDQYSLNGENDLTIYSNGTAVMVLSQSNVISMVFRGLTNAYTTKLNELNYEITDLVIYVNASPGNYAEVLFTMNNQENINLFVISNPSFTFKGLKVSGNWKTLTYENLNIAQKFTDNTKGMPALGLVGNNITLKNCTYTFTCPGDLAGICNSEYFVPIVEGETAKASAIYIVGENINVEECKFTISQQPYMHTDEVNIDLGGGNVFHMDANDWHVYSVFFYHSKNVTFLNNAFSIDSMEKDSSMSSYQYSPIFAGNITELNFINNEVNVRYVPGMNLTTNDTIIENNTINIMNGDYTINLIGDNNIVHYNTLTTELAEGDATVITTGNNNVVEQNPYVEVVEPVLKVDTTEFTVGSTTTISASIYYGDEVANDINKGKVSFKVNGKTLKDASGKVIYAKVTGGVATIDGYEVPQDWAKEGTTIQAVYSGSGDIGKLNSDKETITVTSQEPTITTEDVQATVGSTVTLTATVTAATPVNNGKVVFKINGKTVKDANGKVIYTKVTDGTVNVEYTLPSDMKALEYTLTAVLISSDYGRLEDVKTLTVTG